MKSRRQEYIIMEEITCAVCQFYEINREDISGPSRKAMYVRPRHVGIFLCREYLPNVTWIKIAHFFGRTNHSTCVHAYNGIKFQREVDDNLNHDISNIILDLKFITLTDDQKDGMRMIKYGDLFSLLEKWYEERKVYGEKNLEMRILEQARELVNLEDFNKAVSI